jgi:hypothetical protein
MKILNKVIEILTNIIELYAKYIVYVLIVSICFKLTRGVIGFIFGNIKSIFKLGAKNV